MPFVALAPDHADALVAYLEDYGGEAIPGYFCPRDWPHERCVQKLGAWARGEELQEGWVPCTTVFLVEQGEVLGHYNFRHLLNAGLERSGGHIGYAVRPSARRRGHATRLLGDGLRLAGEHGLADVLVTVSPENRGSVRVIEKCGGELLDVSFHEGDQRDVARYRVAVAGSSLQ